MTQNQIKETLQELNLVSYRDYSWNSIQFYVAINNKLICLDGNMENTQVAISVIEDNKSNFKFMSTNIDGIKNYLKFLINNETAKNTWISS